MNTIEKYQAAIDAIRGFAWHLSPQRPDYWNAVVMKLQSNIDALKPKYRTPTDADAVKRVEVEVRDRDHQDWTTRKLVYVRDGARLFITVDPASVPRSWEFARIKIDPSEPLTVEEAQRQRVCRFCKVDNEPSRDNPFHYARGDEYAHQNCIDEHNKKTGGEQVKHD